LPGDLWTMFADRGKGILASSDLDEFRNPIPCRDQGIEPLQTNNSRTGKMASFLFELPQPPLEIFQEFLSIGVLTSGLRYSSDISPNFTQSLRPQRNHLYRRSEKTTHCFLDLRERDCAHFTLVLGDDEIWP